MTENSALAEPQRALAVGAVERRLRPGRVNVLAVVSQVCCRRLAMTMRVRLLAESARSATRQPAAAAAHVIPR